MVILASEASNRYTHLFLVEREYFGFTTLESVINGKLCLGNYFFGKLHSIISKEDIIIYARYFIIIQQ
jgi:hypothetical protein